MFVGANRYSCRTAALRQVALLLTLFGPTGFAPAAAQGNPIEARVDSLFAEWDLPDSPGCALGLIRDGRLIYERGYGMANLDYDIPISAQTVFYIGSVSKQFAAAAVALLAQQGTISLDDDIRTYLPEMPEYERPITIRHLIHHTSGIRDIYTLMSLAGLRLEDVFSDDEAIVLIASQRELNFAPGDEHLYSNSGYFLLAQIVKRATGTSLRQYAEENIFSSLGMANTHFHDTPDHVLKNRAISYQRRDGSLRISYLSNFNKVGAGGLYTTVQDLLRWDQNFYSGDVGGREFLAQIQTPGVLNDGSELAYAFGLTAGEHRGLSTVGHGGSMMGFRAALLQFPEQHFSVICLCNLGSINPSGLARRVADIYLADYFAEADTRAEPSPNRFRPPDEPSEVALDAAQLVAYAGAYFSPELNVTYNIVVEDGSLLVKRRNSADSRLVATGADTFRERGWRFLFERGEQGNVTAFTVNAGRVTNIRFARTGG